MTPVRVCGELVGLKREVCRCSDGHGCADLLSVRACVLVFFPVKFVGTSSSKIGFLLLYLS